MTTEHSLEKTRLRRTEGSRFMGKTPNLARKVKRLFLSSLLVGCSLSIRALAQAVVAAPVQPPSGELRDGQHDFDFNIGTWKIHSRLHAASAYGLQRLGGSECNGAYPEGLGWPSAAGGDRGRTFREAAHTASLQPAGASVESILCRQRGGCTESTSDRRVQERPRRTLRPGIIQWEEPSLFD